MLGGGYGMGLGAWLAMIGLWLFLIAAVVVTMSVLRDERRRPGAPHGRATAREVLDHRLASGEIDVETHQMLLAELTRDPAAPR